MAREHLLKIGVSGIRGVVGEFLTPALACQFAQAFGTYVGAGRVVVGRDTRASGPMLQHAVICGLLASGCEVVELGVLPTPTIQMYVAATKASGGLAVTASHNPPEYNALKLFNSAGLFFNNYERAELLDLYHQSDFRRAANAEMRKVVEGPGAAPAGNGSTLFPSSARTRPASAGQARCTPWPAASSSSPATARLAVWTSTISPEATRTW